MKARSWLSEALIDLALSWKYRIWALVVTVIALVLSRLPLFNVLGFEFALVMAIAGSLAGADLGSTLVHRARNLGTTAIERPSNPGALISQLIAGASGLTFILLLPALVIISINALWVRNCDWLFGALCFVMMPCLSIVCASGVGVLAGLASGERRRWLRVGLPFALIVLSVILSVVHFYRSPAVFSYNPFAGYFPGNLYDENIVLGAAFYWARLYHFALLCAAASAFSVFLSPGTLGLSLRPKPGGLRLGSLLLLVASASLALLLNRQSGTLRFLVSADDVRQALPSRYESEHFIIHYPANPELTETIETLAADHEFRRAQLVRDLGVDPPDKITSFYFASPEQKYELMGARNVYMAKPWRNEIYVHHQDFPHQVLRHEIAHVMAGAFGDSIFHVSAGQVLGLPVFFNVGMIEGTAVAADWPDHFNKALTPHQSVKAMQSLGMAPPAGQLFSTGFLAFSSARSYTLAGSYLRFLLDRYGIDRLQRLYESGGDFEKAYGRSQNRLTQEWQAHIDSTPLPSGAAEVVREQFRRPAIFDRPCPHAIARSRQRMGEEAARGEFSRAIDTAQSICRDVPGEPVYQLQLAALLSLASRIDDAAEIYNRVANDAENISSTLRAHALFQLSVIRMWQQQESEAVRLLERVLAMPVNDDNLRRAQVELQVLRHTGPASSALRGVFWSTRPGREVDRLVVAGLAAEAVSLEPGLGLGHYLLGRLLRGRGNPKATSRALTRALNDTSLSALVRREAARLLAESSFLAGDMPQLKRAAAILVQASQPEVVRLLGYDWLERMYFAETGQVPAKPLGWVQGSTRSGMPLPTDLGQVPNAPPQAPVPAVKAEPALPALWDAGPEPLAPAQALDLSDAAAFP